MDRSTGGTIVTALEASRADAAEGEAATTANEVPVYLTAGTEHVFGILTRPTAKANGTALLCLHEAAQTVTSHRSGLYTRLCRDAAAAGYTAFRMDTHGTGDSSGVLADRAGDGQTQADVDVAVRWLVEQGGRRVLVVGTCWGALLALAAASRHEVVASACLISPPLAELESGADAVSLPRRPPERLGRALSQGMRPGVIRTLVTEPEYRRWVLGRVRRRVARTLPLRSRERDRARQPDGQGTVPTLPVYSQLLRRRVPVRVLFGETDATYLGLREGTGTPALDAAAEIIDMTVASGRIHGLTTVRAQETALSFMRRWLADDRPA